MLDTHGDDGGTGELNGVPGAGVVDGDAKAAGAQVGDHAPEARDVRHRHTLADFKNHVLGIDARILGELGQAERSVGLRECCQHHVEEQRRGHRVHAPGEPGAKTRLVEILLHRPACGVKERARHLGACPGIDAAE